MIQFKPDLLNPDFVLDIFVPPAKLQVGLRELSELNFNQQVCRHNDPARLFNPC